MFTSAGSASLFEASWKRCLQTTFNRLDRQKVFKLERSASGRESRLEAAPTSCITEHVVR